MTVSLELLLPRLDSAFAWREGVSVGLTVSEVGAAVGEGAGVGSSVEPGSGRSGLGVSPGEGLLGAAAGEGGYQIQLIL